MPVGFKWFVAGLFDGSCCFGGEESAGASFLRFDGTVWTTDKDGPIMDLLAAEITARTGKDPGEHYRRADGGVRHAALHAHRRAGDAASRKQDCKSSRRTAVKESNLARRADHSQADPCAGKQRADRRLESRHGQRMVRRAAFGHGEHLQNLCRELSERSASEHDRQRSAGDCGPSAGDPGMSIREAEVKL